MPFLLCHHLQKRTQWGAVITAESSVLGCSAEATVPLPDRSLAPSEVLLSRQGERHLLRDIAERGRVLVNGSVTREAILKDGDRIQMGKILFVFLENAPQAGKQVSLDTPLESWMRARQARDGSPRRPQGGEEPTAEAPKPRILQTLLVTFAVGCLLGILCPMAGEALFPQAQRGTPEEWVKPPAIRPGGSAEGTTGGPTGSSAEDPLRKLGERLNGGPATAGNEAGPAAKAEPALPPTQAPAQAPAPPPAKFELAPHADPTGSSLGLFRLFLDVAGRPPTRGESRELASVGHDERWRRARELCLPSSPLARALAAGGNDFQLLLGRPPTAEEAEEMARLTTPDRPAAFWITSLAEYRKADRRRPREALQRAASFIVDFLDRPPVSEAELNLVAKVLESPGTVLEVARALAHSGESRMPRWEDDDDASWWEEEHFRFFLRPPTERERAEIPRKLAGLAKGDRRRWFLCVLALKKDYESY